MKTRLCLICGEFNGTVIGIGEDYEYGTIPGPFHYCLCPKCNHMFLAEIPDHDQCPLLYPYSYYTNNPSSPLFLKGMIYRKKIEMDVKRILSIIHGRKINSILDVGCGDCKRLIGLKKKINRDTCMLYGLDFNFSESVKKDARKNGIILIQKNIEDDHVGDIKFDLVMMSQLIEHVYHPAAALRNVQNLLNPGGLLIIETPNWKSLDFQIFKKQYWGGYHFPRHFNIFSALSLKAFVERMGFDVVSNGFLPSPGFWIISLRNMAGLNSRQKTSSWLEFINFGNIAVVGLFSLFDKIVIIARGSTSNQYLVAKRE